MSKRKSRLRRPTRIPDAERYFNWGYSMCRTAAFLSLSGAALKLLIEIRCRFNGSNNGQLSFAQREARLLGLGKTTAARAFDELEDKGFLAMTQRGQWYGHQATLWRLTEKAYRGDPPTCDWKRWTAPPGPKPPLDLRAEPPPRKRPMGPETGPSRDRAMGPEKRTLDPNTGPCEPSMGPETGPGKSHGPATGPISGISAPSMGPGTGRLYNHGGGGNGPRGTAPDDPVPSTADVIGSTSRAPARKRKAPASSNDPRHYSHPSKMELDPVSEAPATDAQIKKPATRDWPF